MHGDSSELNNKGDMARLSTPSPDHYLPLTYLAGLLDDSDEVSSPVEGFDGGTISVLLVLPTQRPANT